MGLHAHRLCAGGPGSGGAHRFRARRHARHGGRADPHVPQPRTVPVALDAHSELMSAYPWGWTTPNAGTFNLQDTGAYDRGALLFRETGTPPVANASPHDWAALVAGSRTPRSHELGPNHRGPAGPGSGLPRRRPGAADVRRRCLRQGHRRAAALASPARPRTSRPHCGSPWPARTRASRPPGPSSRRRWPTRRPRWRRRSRPASGSPRTPRSTCPATRCWSRASRGASRISPTRCRRCTTCSCGRSRKAASTQPRRAPWTRRGGSAPGGPTTRGCSAPTASTPRSPAWRWGSSPRSSRTCGRCATSARSSTATAARWSTR